MLHAVIPAGGSGTRLWPLSRAGRPKFLLALAESGRSLLQATAARLEPLVPAERIIVVTGRPHAAAVTEQLPTLPAANLLAEPSPRESCAAIGLAAAVIARRDPEAIMGSFAADHVVRDGDAFLAAIRAAVAGAEQGRLMTVGMTPDRPATGFGYLHCGEYVDSGPIREVRQFKEKPDRAAALEFVASGEYLWNASMFVWRADTFLAELQRQQPEVHAGVARIAAAWDGPDRDVVLEDVWPELPKIAVDYAVMEDAAARGLVATVPADFGWADVGDFQSLSELIEPGDDGNVVVGSSEPAPLLADSGGVVAVPASGRLMAVLGLDDVVVVDTPDAVLVCARDRVQDVKRLVDELAERGGDGFR